MGRPLTRVTVVWAVRLRVGSITGCNSVPFHLICAQRVEAATGWSLAHLRGQLPLPHTATGGSSSSNAGFGSSTRVRGADYGGDGHAQDVEPRVHRWRPQDDDAGSGPRGGGAGGDWDRRYWSVAGLVAAQFEGLAAGFWASTTDPARNMTWHEL